MRTSLWRCRRACRHHVFTTTGSRLRPPLILLLHHLHQRRTLLTLAIETSCDDTAVAILSRGGSRSSSSNSGEVNGCAGSGTSAAAAAAAATATKLLFNERITSDNREFRGVAPMVAMKGHSVSIGPLLRRALGFLPDADDAPGAGPGPWCWAEVEGRGRVRKRIPDFVSVTRGPGIAGNLTIGLSAAKGLAVAWGVPLVGVHHMQAHALTPRLANALVRSQDGRGEEDDEEERRKGKAKTSEREVAATEPKFPFLSLLVSGGHTQLVHSTALTDHRIVANSTDIAIGNLLDQTARVILPPDVLDSSPDVMYGRLLEAFAFASAPSSRDADTTAEDDPYQFFTPAVTRQDEMVDAPSGYSWTVPLPYRQSRKLAFSFSSIYTHVHRIASANPSMALDERRALARHTMSSAFRHLVGRLVLALEDRPELHDRVRTLVVAGGVACNRFLMHVLRETLAARGFGDMQVVAPPPALCTDNAAMIAWAGMEMFEAGMCSDLSVDAIAKWPMDPDLGKGIMGVDGWLKRGDFSK